MQKNYFPRHCLMSLFEDHPSPGTVFLIRPGPSCQHLLLHFPPPFTCLCAPSCCSVLPSATCLSQGLHFGQWISHSLAQGNICSSTPEPHVRHGHCQGCMMCDLLQSSYLLIQPRETVVPEWRPTCVYRA